jgi:hypothetical protein
MARHQGRNGQILSHESAWVEEGLNRIGRKCRTGMTCEAPYFGYAGGAHHTGFVGQCEKGDWTSKITGPVPFLAIRINRLAERFRRIARRGIDRPEVFRRRSAPR